MFTTLISLWPHQLITVGWRGMAEWVWKYIIYCRTQSSISSCFYVLKIVHSFMMKCTNEGHDKNGKSHFYFIRCFPKQWVKNGGTGWSNEINIRIVARKLYCFRFNSLLLWIQWQTLASTLSWLFWSEALCMLAGDAMKYFCHYWKCCTHFIQSSFRKIVAKL